MTNKTPWSVTVRIEDIPEGGRRFEVAADEPTRAAVADLAGVNGISRLEAGFDVHRRGTDGLHVAGEVSGSVQQTCSVSLEPMTSEIREGIDLVFRPAAGPEDKRLRPKHTVSAEAEEDETLIDGRIDLGEIATEFLLLGVDPYPRKEGAVFVEPAPPAEGSNPFEALARLKK